MMTNHFFISDQYIYYFIPQEFCLKTTTGPGDFEKEIEDNGFGDALNRCEKQMMQKWNDEKWDFFG